VTIEPFTSNQFLLPFQLLVGPTPTPSGFRITIEYEAWAQKRKILQIATTGSLEAVKKMLAHATTEIVSGNLNKVRAKFGKPAIAVNAAQQPAP
jgi:hypothetical protein